MIFAIATGFFAVVTMFNMNMLQANSTGDVSLESIAIMAQAQYAGETVPGYTNPENTVCNIPGGTCDVSAQDPCQAGYDCD